MTTRLLDAMTSLAALMQEETDQVSRAPYHPGLSEIAAAKLRLTGQIETEIARMKREAPDDWLDRIAPEMRDQLAEASLSLRDISTVNADILARQIDLSAEMMAAIAAEAQRLSGRRSTVYEASGGLGGMDVSAPISINARL
ncbi:flagellar protein FlgN [uncultured Sphingomonas sp.]|uniref:flagellar protein FlgN n=1 Tax=uncultured Sphingomonas sp. TaxID=158754 RepID=UPI00262DA6F2|nr:flagellar protein FlgN [uncultured Sphingomonas sp.]